MTRENKEINRKSDEAGVVWYVSYTDIREYENAVKSIIWCQKEFLHWHPITTVIQAKLNIVCVQVYNN